MIAQYIYIYIYIYIKITSAGAVDREFVYIEPPRALPDLSHSLPELPLYRSATELSRDVFLTFVGTSHAKPSLLRAFLEGIRLIMVSTVGVIDERSPKKSKKHCTGASPKSPSTEKIN